MGRYAGWIAIYAGMAGGADVILIPEIPFTYDSICAKITRTRSQGENISRSSSARKARGKKAAGFCHLRRAGSRIARRGWAASARSSRRKSRNAPARKRAYWCSAICSAAAARRLRPRALLVVRRGRRGADRRRRLWQNGCVHRATGRFRADCRRRRPAEDRYARRQPDADGARPRNFPRRLNPVLHPGG